MLNVEEAIALYREECAQELNDILFWWKTHMPDEVQGGFLGQIDQQNMAVPDAPKGLVLNSRILWTFSSAGLIDPKGGHLTLAQRAFNYLINFFMDPLYGGFFWSLDASGAPLETRKQVYGQAFAIYGLSAYYELSGDEHALAMAKETYALLEKYSYDANESGYLEAFSREWGFLDDLRLSAKDLNAVKSMNTHLHVIEAYANLYRVWKDDSLKEAIQRLLGNFRHSILGADGHLKLFFNGQWESLSKTVSFGHDIEAAWLLQEAAEVINEPEAIDFFRALALRMATVVESAVDSVDGGLFYERLKEENRLIKEKHWWPQAEAMVGFYNAYELSNDSRFLAKSMGCWRFVQQNLRDTRYGEWHWGRDEDGSLLSEPKAGFWKCPYHNARACMELIKRIPANTVQ